MINGAQIREIGLDIISKHPDGIGPTDLGKAILALHPSMKDENGRPNGTIRGAVWDLDRRFPERVKKTASGFAPVTLAETIKPQVSVAAMVHASDIPSAAPGRKRAAPTPELAEAKAKIAALEDAVRQAHSEIEGRDKQIAALRGEIDQRKPDSIGVIREAQDAATLIDIRQAVLAGSDEPTLAAVQRIVADLAQARTRLGLTGIADDGARLKAARKLAGVTQKTLGARLGFAGRHTIDLIERGMRTLAKHEKVLRWVERVESKHVQDRVIV